MEDTDLAADLAAVAQRYLDLWDMQVTAAVGVEPAQAAADAAKIMAEALVSARRNEEGAIDNGSGTTPNASPAPGAASIGGDDVNDEFARRLAQCAEQFSALAAGTGGGSGGAKG
jgi:hypothetical protein